jgi:plasmid stabilization system protein ParE
VKPVHIAEIAIDDLVAITQYILSYSTKAAGDFVDAFDKVLDDLRRFPEIGTLEPDAETRVLRRDKYLFIYIVESDHLELTRILDGRRRR